MSWIDTLRNGMQVAAGATGGMAKPNPYQQMGQSVGNFVNDYRAKQAQKKGEDQANSALSGAIDQAVQAGPRAPVPPPPVVPARPSLYGDQQPDQSMLDPTQPRKRQFYGEE